MLTLLRLDRRLRFALYGAISALFVTGAAWLWAIALKDGPEGELWQAIAAKLLMLHGGAAMTMLIVFGALIPLHNQRAWRAGKNRKTGSVTAAFNLVLVVTAFGFYYAGSDVLRKWLSDIHIAIGLSIPPMLFFHIWSGRRAMKPPS